MHNAGLDPKKIEVISPVRKSPGYSLPFNILIPPSKDNALTFAKLNKTEIPVRIYSDGSGFKGGICVATLLYLKDRLVRTLQYYLGTEKEHTVYAAEGVGLVMGLHLPKGLNIT